jgi:CheY-like chemotaxis protein
MFRPASQAAPLERVPTSTRPLRLLVADDERDTVLTLTVLLRHEGYEVRGVYDGAQVLDSVAVFKPDVVILDIGMPLLNGYETARVLRARYGADYPVLIAVTAYCKPTDVMLAKLAGFDHHFAKPVRPQLLAELLAKITPKPAA